MRFNLIYFLFSIDSSVQCYSMQIVEAASFTQKRSKNKGDET